MLLARSIATGLRREGIAVDVVLDGSEALLRLGLTRYDIVVLDRDLPVVHGDEVCRRIVAEQTASRILMLTAGPEIGYYYAMRYISERSTDPGLLVLASLAEGPKHGYAITQDVEAVAGVRLGPGSLYGALSRLEGRGLIEALPSKDRRRPYKITAAGSAALAEQLQMLDRVVDTGLKRLRAAEAH